MDRPLFTLLLRQVGMDFCRHGRKRFDCRNFGGLRERAGDRKIRKLKGNLTVLNANAKTTFNHS